MRNLLVASLALFCLAGCASPDKKLDSQSATGVNKKPSALSADEIQTKYSLAELNSAANVLKVVSDDGQEIIGCTLTSREAMSMTMPLKFLIDQSVRSESEAYSQNPKAYTDDHSFKSCALTCACGVFSDVVEAANQKSFPAGSQKIHSRNQQRLGAKASHQLPGDSLACAKKQSWFCASDLKIYLEKEAHENSN